MMNWTLLLRLWQVILHCMLGKKILLFILACSADLMSNCSQLAGNDFVEQLCSVLLSVFPAPFKTASSQRTALYILFFTWWDSSINLVYAVRCGLDLGLALWFFGGFLTKDPRSYWAGLYWHFPSFIISTWKPWFIFCWLNTIGHLDTSSVFVSQRWILF